MKLRPPRPGPHSSTTTLSAALALGLLAVGCSGSIQDGGRSGTSTTGKPNTPGVNPGPNGTNNPPPGNELPPLNPGQEPPRPEGCVDVSPGPAPLRRLTRVEYDNTLKDLLGEDKGLAKSFPTEELGHSFDNNATLRSVSDVLAENYTTAAEVIGKAVVGKMGTVLSCDPASKGDAACLDAFFDGFGKRMWRRPLSTTERDDLKKVFMTNKGSSFAEGLDAVVQVMVLAPQFMYRLEKGVEVPGKSYSRLTHYEMASRLSYFFWNTMPDAELFTAADGNKLGTREEVKQQAERMIKDPRATAMVTNFASQWLQLRELKEADKDTEVYPQWKDEYLELFRQETEAFVAEVWKTDSKLDTLLTAPFSMVNGALGTFYGVKGATGETFSKVQLDPTQRAGFLTHASIMAAKAGPDQSSPIFRGVWVREQLLCQELPQVPEGLNAMPPMLNNTMTTKERFAAHRNDPSCTSCHNLIDSIGFGFEKYDATGAWRTMESNKMVDATGELFATDVDGKFDGAIELSKKLAASKEVEACMAQNAFYFGFGREKTEADKCTSDSLKETFAKSGGNMKELLLALVQTDAFFFKGGQQ